MTYLKSYKELIVWQRSMELAKEIFKLTALFPKSELYGIVTQMRRAVISICSNIAEGYGRNSPGEFKQFLGIANGSALELETQLILSKELGYIKQNEFIKLETILTEVLKMLYSMMKKVNVNSKR